MKRWLAIGGGLLAIAVAWLVITNNSWVWPRRNFVYYQFLSRWWGIVGEPQAGPPGTLEGTIRNDRGEPIVAAWILLARWDGTTYTARSNAEGHYIIRDIPAGRYIPVVGAPGYASTTAGQKRKRVRIQANTSVSADLVPAAETPRSVVPGKDLTLDEPSAVSCTTPLEASAVRRRVTFDSGGRPNQPALFYTPLNPAADRRFPFLLTVYPGPADSWECASVPLAAAGYTVLAIGPTYTLELDPDVDELERILGFAAAELFPHTNPAKIGLLGGSYSGIHVQLLLRRKQAIQAAVLLGAPSDIFAMRRHLEQKTFIPPFGLDQVLIALGLPDRQPERYWHYSGAYHVRETMPPMLIIHSRDDEVVPVDQSDLLAAGLAEAGVPHQVHYFDAASHYLLSPGGESLAIYDLTLDFLAEQLGE